MSNEQRFTSEQVEMLQAPLDVSAIKFRPGGGRQLKYIKGDTAIDAANRVFGFGQWGYTVIARSHERIEDEKKGLIEFYTADIELHVVGAAFPFPGDGVGIVTAPYTVETHEKARKEAATDALKRALRHYGDQFGLSLYSEDDYVDAGDGTLIQVKEVKPGQQKQAPKRVVESSTTLKQIAPKDARRTRLNELYTRALALNLIPKSESADENVKRFLVLAGEAINANITSPEQLTDSRLDLVEKYINSKDAAVA